MAIHPLEVQQCMLPMTGTVLYFPPSLGTSYSLDLQLFLIYHPTKIDQGKQATLNSKMYIMSTKNRELNLRKCCRGMLMNM